MVDALTETKNIQEKLIIMVKITAHQVNLVPKNYQHKTFQQKNMKQLWRKKQRNQIY